jgi:RNA polymerase sigma factor (sigma-70 family)
LVNQEPELIARCLKGDIQSYATLYRMYSRAMYHTCLRVVLVAADADDILQEAFAEAFMNLDRLKDPEAFGGWLKRIVLNKSFNYVNRKRQSWLELGETDLSDYPEEAVINETVFAQKLEGVLMAINNLPEKYRILINLHVFEQMSFEEIGSFLHLNSSTVRVQYMRARQKILSSIKITA